jgi:hypothetical protein
MKDIIYPFGTLEPPPRLRVAGLRLDGTARPAPIKSQARRVDLFEEKAEWRRAELELEFAADRDAARRFEAEHGELTAIAVVHCPPTRASQSARLRRSPCDEAR